MERGHGRRREALRRGCRILVVGTDGPTRTLLETLVREVARGPGLARFQFVDRLPERRLDRYAAILLDARSVSHDAWRLLRHPALAWRCRVLVDPGATLRGRLWPILQDGALRAVVIGGREPDVAREGLAELLLSEPLVRHVHPVLAAVCTAGQAELAREFLRRLGVATVGEMARVLLRSERALSRECESLGLRTPQELVRAGRVCRGLAWAAFHDVSLARVAVPVAGYSEPAPFYRAAWDTFGVTAGALLREWGDPVALRPRFQKALLREGGQGPGA